MGEKMSQEYRLVTKSKHGLATMISPLSTPMLLGGQDQFLKVSIYTVDMEQFFCLSAVVSMSFFISHMECQNSLKILQKKQGSRCNGGISFQQEATDNVDDSTINYQSQEQE
jgi:hypothetical protein